MKSTNYSTQTIVLIITLTFSIGLNAQKKYTAIKLWESQPELKVPESVIYYQKANILFVSNINGNPGNKDNNGFISKLNTEGDILKLKWLTGMNAPKGMGIHDDMLYVTDIDEVIKINIAENSIVKKYAVENAQFLNDIDISPDGLVYVSDMQDNTIYVIEDDEIKKWLSSEKLNRVNGLLFMEGNLYAGVRDKIQMIHATKKHIRTIVQNTGSIDGLEYAGNNCYIISDWQGTVSLVHPEKEKIILSNTSAKDINAADIDYIQDKKMIVVPTFFDNRVVAYELHHQ